MQEVNFNRKKCMFITKVAVAVCVGAVLLAGIIIIAIHLLPESTSATPTPSSKRSIPIKRSDSSCQTKKCSEQASRILSNMNASVDPCTDFYNFACGTFMKHAKIPNDQTRLLVVLENKQIVEDNLIEAYNADPKLFHPLIRDMKTFYQQCVNSESLKRKSYKSIKKILLKLKWPVLYKNWNEYADTFNWLDWEARFSNMGLSAAFLNTELKFDMRNFSLAYIGLDCTTPSLQKPILGSSKNEKFIKVYRRTIKKLLKIIARGYRGSAAEEITLFFLKVENIKPTRYEMSDSNFFNAFRNVTVERLEKVLNISLEKFLKNILPSSVAITKDTVLGTNSYQCLINLTSMLNKANKRQTANYMIWITVKNLLWILSKQTRQLDFELNQARTGVEAPLPLYRMCLNFIDDYIPELSSAMYVKIHFSKNKKKDLNIMVNLLKEELRKVVEEATWMDEATKKTARKKVKKLSYIIDHVEAITQDSYLTSSYGKLDMTSPDVIQNIMNIKKAAYNHMMETFTWTSVKRNEVTLLPLAHVINAFYHQGLNAIAIPTGIALGSIYAHEQEAYLNFGAIGIIIGHELTHVFDNIARLYDADGNFVNWWTNESNYKFEEKSRCFVDQYNNYSLGPNLKLNGTLTLGENMADTGGTLLAYRAYLKWKEKYVLKKLPGLEDFTLDQMFWISVGNTWCDKIRPETLEMFLKTDVHAVGNFRVLGPLSDSEEFSRDFNCPKGSKMNRPRKCTIW